MKVQKTGDNYKIKCSGVEYDALKYCIFELFENADPFMRDWVLEHRILDDDLEDIAYVMKGTD